jgi:hypothetical protein
MSAGMNELKILYREMKAINKILLNEFDVVNREKLYLRLRQVCLEAAPLQEKRAAYEKYRDEVAGWSRRRSRC